jgi:hypothetical protein
MTDVGFIENGLRFLTGVPVERIKLKSYHNLPETLWNTIWEYHQKEFYMGTTTEGSNNQMLNEYGLAQGHAFYLVKPFVLKDHSGLIKHKLYMMRNPWGISSYSGKWNHLDTKNWKPFFVK